MAAPEGTPAPGGHPRTLSRPSGADSGHRRHPQASRRPEDNHTEMASLTLTCGTAAGDHHKAPPANRARHSVPRGRAAGGNGPEAPGMARRPRDEPVRGAPRPPRGDLGHSCTAAQLGRRGYDSVHFL